MEATEKSELISACRQYADAKFKLRGHFPSLKTSEEIDNIATILIDVASSALSSALNGEAKKIKKSLARVEKTPAAPVLEEPESTTDRIRAVIMANGNVPMTAAQIATDIEERGWYTNSGRYPFAKDVRNTVMKKKDIFVRKGRGLYAARRN